MPSEFHPQMAHRPLLLLRARSREKLTFVLGILPLKILQDTIWHSAALNYKTRLDLTAEATEEPRGSAGGDAIKIESEAELTSLFHRGPKQKIHRSVVSFIASSCRQ
jgi:hypothetical protein